MERARKRYNLKSKLVKVYAKREFKKKPFTDISATSKLRCEFLIYVRAASGTQLVVNANSNSYTTINTELGVNYSWTQYSQDFLKFKIYGISAHASPVHGNSDVSDGATSIPIGLCFYPNYANASISSNEVMNNDSTFRIEPLIGSKQIKYWSFPDNFYELSGYGYGVWSPVSGLTNLPGQFSLGNNPPFANFGSFKTLYMIRVCVYILLGFKRY